MRGNQTVHDRIRGGAFLFLAGLLALVLLSQPAAGLATSADTVNVTATKVWEGEPKDVYLGLYRQRAGWAVPALVTGFDRVALPKEGAPAGEQWQHTWEGLPRYSSGDIRYPWTYTVREFQQRLDGQGNPMDPPQYVYGAPSNYSVYVKRVVDEYGNTNVELTNTQLPPFGPTEDGDLATKPREVNWNAKTTGGATSGYHHDMKVSPFMQAEPGSNSFNQRRPLSQGALSIGYISGPVFRFVHGTFQDVQDGVLTVDLNPLIDGLKGTGYSLDYRSWGPIENWKTVVGSRFERKGTFFIASTPEQSVKTMEYVTGTKDYGALQLITPEAGSLILDDNDGQLYDGKFYLKTPYMAANTAYVFQLQLFFKADDPEAPASLLSDFPSSGHRFTIQADFKANYRCALGEKAWLGGTPSVDAVQLQLYQIDPLNPDVEVPYGDPVTVSAAGIVVPMGPQPAVTLPPWSMLWTHLPIMTKATDNAPAGRYQYVVKEVPRPGNYELVSTQSTEVEDPDSVFGPHITKVTLMNRPLTALTVTKAWVNDTDSPNPDSVAVELLRDGEPLKPAVTQTLSAENQWTHTFAGLPGTDDSGKAHVYTVREKAVPGYNTAQRTDDKTGAVTITNTRVKSPPAPTPEPEPTYPTLEVPLYAKKALKNGALKAGEFTFLLKDAKGNVLAEVGNLADGTVVFPQRTFSRVVKNYIYTISEKAGNEGRMQYDNTVYTVKVSTSPQNGKLVATVDILKDGAPYAGDVVFTNVRQLPKTGDSFPGTAALMALAALLLSGAATLVRRRKVR